MDKFAGIKTKQQEQKAKSDISVWIFIFCRNQKLK